MTTTINKRKTLSIIGAGKLGRTLGRLWHDNAVFDIADVVTRTAVSAQQATEFIGAGRAVAGLQNLVRADICLLAVGDNELPLVCAELEATGYYYPGQLVFHCSGALSSTALEPAADAGASIASIHPIRSFAQPPQVLGSFAGTWCGVEGEASALAVLNPAFEAIGGRMVSILAEHKTLYHAAAVIASNYLVTLMDASLQAYEGAGVPREQALQMIQPLVSNTMDNIFRAGPEEALSGPIARGDLDTVERQWKALVAYRPGLGDLYSQLARHTMALAQRRKKP